MRLAKSHEYADVCIACTDVEAVTEFEQHLLSDLRRYTTALQRLVASIIYSLLVVVLAAIVTRLLGCILCRSRDPRHVDPRDPGADDVMPARPATVSVTAQPCSFTVSELRFSETKV